MKITIDTMGNRTRDPVAFKAVPQPTVPPRAVKLRVVANNYRRLHNALSCDGLELYPHIPMRYNRSGDLITYELGAECSNIATKPFTIVCQIVSFVSHSD
jgi:hypothetical protein